MGLLPVEIMHGYYSKAVLLCTGLILLYIGFYPTALAVIS